MSYEWLKVMFSIYECGCYMRICMHFVRLKGWLESKIWSWHCTAPDIYYNKVQLHMRKSILQLLVRSNSINVWELMICNWHLQQYCGLEHEAVSSLVRHNLQWSNLQQVNNYETLSLSQNHRSHCMDRNCPSCPSLKEDKWFNWLSYLDLLIYI